MIEKIHRITKEQTERFLFLGVLLLLFLLPIPQFIMADRGKATVLQTTWMMFGLFYFIFFLIVEACNKRIRLKPYKAVFISVIGLFVWGLVTVLYAEDKLLALYGELTREEGLISLAVYYAVFLATASLRNETYRKGLCCGFLLLGCMISVLGVLQFTEICTLQERWPGTASVPMCNPNFFASFAVLFTGVGMGGFYLCQERDTTTRLFSPRMWPVWYALVLLGYAACISADSSVAYVGLIMMLSLYLFLEVATKRRRLLPFLSLIIGLAVLVFLLDKLKSGGVSQELLSVGNQIQAEGTVLGNSVGSGRMGAWKKIVALLPEYGLFGCGIEHLGELYIERYGVINGVYFDKAHNEYLHLWITQGIPAVLLYLTFLFALFFPGVRLFFEKKAEDGKQAVFGEIEKVTLFAFFGYVAQAFFNISVIQVAPYFWMLCGLLYRRKGKEDEETMDW